MTTPAKDMSASTTVMVFHGANFTTEASAPEYPDLRPVDEDDENDDPLAHLHKDIEDINIVEPQDMVLKDKKFGVEGNKAYKFEAEAVKNENMSMANHQHDLASNNTDRATDEIERDTELSLAVGIEPAIALGSTESSQFTDTLLTPRILPAGENAGPKITMNESLSSIASPDDEKALDGNVTENMSVTGNDFLPSVNSESSNMTSKIAGNISAIKTNLRIVNTTVQEDGSSSAVSTAPTVVPSADVTTSELPEVPVGPAVTLSSNDLAKLHKGTVPMEYDWTNNSTQEFNTTTDASQSGSNDGVIHNWIPESNMTISRPAILEPSTVFSKCASGWLVGSFLVFTKTCGSDRT
jgi:hypothetical protein